MNKEIGRSTRSYSSLQCVNQHPAIQSFNMGMNSFLISDFILEHIMKFGYVIGQMSARFLSP